VGGMIYIIGTHDRYRMLLAIFAFQFTSHEFLNYFVTLLKESLGDSDFRCTQWLNYIGENLMPKILILFVEKYRIFPC